MSLDFSRASRQLCTAKLTMANSVLSNYCMSIPHKDRTKKSRPRRIPTCTVHKLL